MNTVKHPVPLPRPASCEHRRRGPSSACRFCAGRAEKRGALTFFNNARRRRLSAFAAHDLADDVGRLDVVARSTHERRARCSAASRD